MIVTCENCSTKFNLDEGLIKKSGSKVRCSKCQHIFTVYKLAHDEEPESAVELEQDLADLQDSAETPQPSIEAEETPETGLDFGLPGLEEEPVEEVALEAFGLEEEPAAEELPHVEEEPAVEETPDAEEALEEEFDFDLSDLDEEPAGEEPAEEVALEAFGLEEEPALEELPQVEEEPAAEETPDAEEAPEEELDFDLSDLDEEPAEEETAEKEFDFDLSDLEGEPPGEETAQEEIALDALDFDEEPAAEGLADEETPEAEEAPEEELDFDLSGLEEVPLEETFEVDGAELIMEETEATEVPKEEMPDAVSAELLEGVEEEEVEQVEEELMPPPQAEKELKARKRISTPLMIVLILVLLAGGVIAGYTILQSLDIKIPFVESLIGVPESETTDPGNLHITTLDQLIKTEFVENKTAGRLFVIRGKIRNDYPEARNFIMVKGVVYSRDGKVVQEKAIYCGNTLSDTALQAMDKATIDTRLRNKFGDGRSNFMVTSGKVIPFVVVFPDLPQDLGEFSVEVVSSDPAD